jgi:hypothetical protein
MGPKVKGQAQQRKGPRGTFAAWLIPLICSPGTPIPW